MSFPLSLLFIFVCHILLAASQMVHVFRNVGAYYVEGSVMFRLVFLLVEHFCIRWMVLGVTLKDGRKLKSIQYKQIRMHNNRI